MIVPVSKLKFHPKNQEIYSISNIEDLEQSISSLGLLEKLVIDEEFQVISGNRRLVAIQNLGWKKVDCEKVTLPKDEVLTYLIHHNKQRIKTCREQLNEVKVLMDQYKIGQGKRTDILTCENPHTSSKKTRDVVGEMVGMSGYQITKLLLIDKENEEMIDLIDKGILTINQAYIQTTRIKKERESRLEIRKNNVDTGNSNFRFYNKSSVIMNEIEDGEVDLIFTSPPYWNKRKYTENGGLGNEKKPNDYVDNLVSHLTDCKRVLNKKGSFFLNLGDTFNDGNLLNIPHKVIIGLQDEGWILRNSIIWAKTNPKPSSSKSNLCPTYEFIFHLVKSSDYIYNPTLAPIKDSTKPSHPPRHRNLKDNNSKINPYIPREGKNMGDWWSEEIVQSAVVNQKLTDGVEHPAPFPEKIVILPVLQTTNEGDLVLDPFCGSMTTGKVSERFNRQFVGYDVQVY
jgi:DNA modification methylase